MKVFSKFIISAYYSRNTTYSSGLHSLVKAEAKVWEQFKSTSMKIKDEVGGGGSSAQEISQTLPRFSSGYEGTEKMF